MPAQLTDYDRLLFGFKKLDFLDINWLEERMAEAQPKFDVRDATLLNHLFSELPFRPTWLAQAWTLYTSHSPRNEQIMQRNVAFLHFILGLKDAWPKQTAFSEIVMRRVMTEGNKRATQILNIVHIFHEDSDIL